MESGDVLTLVLVTLAVYRISVMIAQEEGPFSMFATLRSRIDPNQTRWYGRGLRCVACLSFWLAGLAALLIHGSVLDWLAISGGVLVIHRAVK